MKNKKLYILIAAMLFGIADFPFSAFRTSFSILCAQQIGTWQVYPSYWQVNQGLFAGCSVYCLTTAQETMKSNNRERESRNYNLMRYDVEDTSVKTYNNIEDLNDVHLAHIGYSHEAKRVILVYENGNIDLLDMDDNVVNVSSLKESSLNNKNVNNVSVDGATAYLSTGFGIVVLDMKEGVIRDTYRLDLNVQALTSCDGTLYLGTSNGLYRSTDGNKHLLSNWQKLSDRPTSCRKMVTFDGYPYMLSSDGVQQWNGERLVKLAGSDGSKYLTAADGKMIFGTANAVYVYSRAAEYERIDHPNAWQDLTLKAGIFWACEGMNGLHGYRLNNGNFVEAVGKVQPNSPVRDFFYRIHYAGDRLLVAGGTNTDNPIYHPATAMYYEDGQWTNFDEETPVAEYPALHHWNTTNLVQDPADASHHFASPYRTGLYEYRNGKFVKLYNSENSPLEQIRNYGLNYVSCSGLQYDEDGNLWMMNQNTDTIMRILQPSGKWLSLYYDEIKEVKTPDDYLFTTSGVKFLISRRMDGRGFFGFHTNGTLSNVRDDKHRLITTLVNQDGTSYTPDRFYCMTEDLDGRVWCGTLLGLFVINDPTKFFDSDFVFEQIKIARNDGSGLADYLLSGVSVTCIAVDGANRKWIGTESNGLYLISADGQEMIHHFETENTPLLSNTIQSIAIHPATGMVMIGTDKGLCSYVSDATEAEAELRGEDVVVYPNPVRPDYTGPIAVRGLMMDSEVKICSPTGQLVWSGTSQGGTFTWNGRNKQGKRVSSGVYHVIANTPDGHKAVVGRIAVIKD